MKRREFMRGAAGAAVGLGLLGDAAFILADKKPNIVVIMTDDLGYGDLGCYGSSSIKTPNLDRLAGQGVRLTSFYSSSPVCSPSRCGLLTGRYPVRAGVHEVFFPSQNLATPLIHSTSGLGDGMNTNEIISAELLKNAGYATCCIGKWHLGDKKKYRPNHRGFDHFLGLHYSNDMAPLPLYLNDKVVQKSPVDQTKLTGWYTREALKWIGENKDNPFFLYMPHTFPHEPLHAGDEFRGRSDAGIYGDCVEEVDWSVGRVLDALEEHGLADNTFVFFTSDNGPWFQGSAGNNRGRKSEIFDGGQRVPGIARWPGVISAGAVSDEIAMNIDLFSTVLAVAGAQEPKDRIIDGRDIMPMLKGDTKSPHDALFFYEKKELQAVRTPRWKYHRMHRDWSTQFQSHDYGPCLFDMSRDRNESYNVADKYPEEAARLAALMDTWDASFVHDVPGWQPAG